MGFPVVADFAVSQVCKGSLRVADCIFQSFPFTHSISNGDAQVFFQELIIFCIHPSRFKRELKATRKFPATSEFQLRGETPQLAG